MLGADRSGKTSLIHLLHDSTPMKTKRSIVYDAYPHLLVTADRKYALQIFELQGEKLVEHQRLLFNGVAAILVLCDVCSKQSVRAAIQWKEDIDVHVKRLSTDVPVPCMLVVNKPSEDEDAWAVSFDYIHRKVQKHSFKQVHFLSCAIDFDGAKHVF